jgi:hypothetical protein
LPGSANLRQQPSAFPFMNSAKLPFPITVVAVAVVRERHVICNEAPEAVIGVR